MIKSRKSVATAYKSLLAIPFLAAALGAWPAQEKKPPCTETRTVFEPLWLGMSEDAARNAIGPSLKLDMQMERIRRESRQDEMKANPGMSPGPIPKMYEANGTLVLGLKGKLKLDFNELGRLTAIEMTQDVGGTVEGRQSYEATSVALGLPAGARPASIGAESKCESSRASSSANTISRWARFGGSGAGLYVHAMVRENAYALPPIERPVESPPPKVAPGNATGAGDGLAIPYGPSLSGLRLGMTEAAAQQLLGKAMSLHERYRKFATFSVEAHHFLGQTGRLMLQFDEGRGLSKVAQHWDLSDWNSASRAIDSAIAWAEIDAGQAHLLQLKLRSDEARAKRFAATTPEQHRRDLKADMVVVKSGSRERTKYPDEEDVSADARRRDSDLASDVSVFSLKPGQFMVTLTVASMRWVPLEAANGEDPLRDRWSDADEAFEESLIRAKNARGVLSPYHGTYAAVCQSAAPSSLPFNRTFARLQHVLRFLIWSEGDAVYSHSGRSTKATQSTVLAVRGTDELVFSSSDGSKEKLKVFMIDIDEKLPDGQKTRFVFADGKVMLAKGEELKGLHTLRLCARP